MSRHDAKNHELAVARLSRRLAAEPRLQAEIRRARREFFGGDAPLGAKLQGAADTAEHRFAEWFALERESDTLGAVPVDIEPFADAGQDVSGSIAGVFLVQATAAGSAAARDLQDETVLDLFVPDGSLQAGDLVVGRLYASGSGSWTPSTAAAVFRPGATIAKAFVRDVQRLELDRRLRQIELEHLLLRRPDQARSPTSSTEPAVPLERLEAELESLLQQAGSEHAAGAISEQLALAVRPGPVMGPLLDELAFDTEVDLDRLRSLLLQIWNHHHDDVDQVVAAATAIVDPERRDGPPGETLGERLVRTLDEGLQQKRDVEELFAQLERMAGLAPGAADELDEPSADEGIDRGEDESADRDRGYGREPDEDDERLDDAADGDEDGDPAEAQAVVDPEDDGAPAGGIEGDLLPLVEEYLWETEQTDHAVAAPLRAFAELQQNAAVPRQDLEQLEAADVMRFLLHVYLAAPATERSSAVRRAFTELGRFCHWAATTQEMAVGKLLDPCQGPLLDHLDRLQAAGVALSSAGRPARRPGILLVEDVGEHGFGVRDDDGEHHWLLATAAQTALLRRGDLVLAAFAAGPAGGTLAGPVVVLPADARALME